MPLLDMKAKSMIMGIRNMCLVAAKNLENKQLISINNKDDFQEELFKFAMSILNVVSKDFIEYKEMDGDKVKIMVNGCPMTIDSGVSGGYSAISKKKTNGDD